MEPPPPDGFTVRAYALEQAVKLYADQGPSPTNSTIRNSEIITAAKTFEAYLAAPSADQGQHAETTSRLANLIT